MSNYDNNPKFVYAIQHNKTHRIYIGSTLNVSDRYYNHIFKLRKGEHQSQEMQEDYDAYGEDYSVYVLEKVENPDKSEQSEYGEYRLTNIREAEYKWMKKYNTIIDGYNTQDWHAKKYINKEYKRLFPLKEGLPEPLTGSESSN